MDLRTAKDISKSTWQEIKNDEVTLLSSAVAFRVFLSFFPGLIAAVAVFGLVTDPSELSGLLLEARAVLPTSAYDLLEQTLISVTGSASGGFALVGAVGGLWAASSAAAVLIKALNLAYDVQERRPFLKLRAAAFGLTGLLLLAIVTLIALLVVGRHLQQWLLPDSWNSQELQYVITAARIVASIVVLMVLLALLYWLGPNREGPRFRWITPGAVGGVLAWLMLSAGFGLYARWFGNYNATYGALGGAVVLMLWLQMTMVTLLAGAELNQVLERRRTQGMPTRRSATPHSGSEKGSTVAAPD